MNAHALLVLVLAVHVMPEHLAELLGQSEGAWTYVAHGIEAAALWLTIGVMIRSMPVLAVSTYGAMEGLQRAACRLALPMDRAPSLAQGQTLCDAATGTPVSLMSLVAAVVVVVLVDTERRPWRC
jgi:hypothetical protein